MEIKDMSGMTEGSLEIEREMNSVWNENQNVFQQWQLQADSDMRFYTGDQSSYGRYYQNLVNPGELQFNFNLLLRIHNLIVGYQIRTRKSPQAIPQENSDALTASQFSGLLQWNFQANGFYDLVSQAFSQAVITGFGAIELWLDSKTDPVSPDIKGCLRGYNNVVFDPYAVQKDLSDANYFWSRSYMTPEEVKNVLPFRVDDVRMLNRQGYKDEKFIFMLENWNLTPRNLMSVDNYWHIDTRKCKMLVDVYSGDYFEISDDIDKNQLNIIMQSQGERIEYVEKEVPTVKLAIAVNGKVLYHGNPYGIDKYPIIPFFAYWTPTAPTFNLKCQGVINSLKSAQFLYSRRKRIELDILESRGTSSLVIMENTLVDDRQAFQVGQGRALFVKKDSPMGMDGIRPLPPPNVGGDMIQLSQLLKDEIMQISGVNEELLGSADDASAGILSMLRQGAGLTTLQILFDNVDYATTELSRRMMSMIQSNWTSSKIRRILNEEPSPQFKNKAFQKYDVIAINGKFSATQQQMEFAQLLELRQLGIPVPTESLLQASTLQNKDRLIEQIKQQEQQQQQAQQQQQQLEMQQIEANNELVRARAIADSGLGAERYSRIQENRQLAEERKAQAQKDNTDALLNFVRALKELDTLEIENLVKALNLQKVLDEYQKGKQQIQDLNNNPQNFNLPNNPPASMEPKTVPQMPMEEQENNIPRGI